LRQKNITLKLRTTAAAINAVVKLRYATHYNCTSGECGNPLCDIFPQDIRYRGWESER